MKTIDKDSKIIKCIDRYHNLIRAFSIKDVDYLDRYIDETQNVYVDGFENIEELRPLQIDFYDTLDELKKYRDILKGI